MIFVFYPNLFDYLTLIFGKHILWPVASGKTEVVIRWRLWLVNPLSPNGDLFTLLKEMNRGNK